VLRDTGRERLSLDLFHQILLLLPQNTRFSDFRGIYWQYQAYIGPGSSVGIATDHGLDGPGSIAGEDEIFRLSSRPLDPPSLLYNGYRVFPGGKVWLGRAADHSPSSSAAVMEE